ncbi:MAG: serine hydrolase, partial [Cytophagales bacterium]
HTGDNPGYQTIIVRFIEENKTIIVLNNNAHPDQIKLVEAATLSLRKW